MLAALKDWRVIAGTGLLLWAAGLQVSAVVLFHKHQYSGTPGGFNIERKLHNKNFLQAHMRWLQKQPEFKQKFPEAEDPASSEHLKIQFKGQQDRQQ